MKKIIDVLFPILPWLLFVLAWVDGIAGQYSAAAFQMSFAVFVYLVNNDNKIRR